MVVSMSDKIERIPPLCAADCASISDLIASPPIFRGAPERAQAEAVSPSFMLAVPIMAKRMA